jgi:hypothetical protein
MVMVAIAFIVLDDAAEADPIAATDDVVVLLSPPPPGNEEAGILLSFVLESAILLVIYSFLS